MSTTGGNKKCAGPSAERYWARAQMSNFAEVHRERRIKRHEKRMAKKAMRLRRRESRPRASFA